MNKEDVKDGWDYFMYYPDKTEVIIQVYLLNPLFNFITNIIFSIVNFVRSVLKIILKIA